MVLHLLQATWLRTTMVYETDDDCPGHDPEATKAHTRRYLWHRLVEIAGNIFRLGAHLRDSRPERLGRNAPLFAPPLDFPGHVHVDQRTIGWSSFLKIGCHRNAPSSEAAFRGYPQLGQIARERRR